MTDQTHAKGLTTLADYTLTYDDLKRVTTFTSGAKGTNTDTYDPISQLKDSLGTLTAAENYSYDANGNRTNSGYSTNSNDRLTSDGVSNYQSDNEGNRTRKTTIATNDYVEYTWDHRNRLVRVDFKTAANVLTKRIEYSYDAFDRRIAKRVHDTGTTAFDRDEYYAYDGEDVVLVYTDPDGEGTASVATRSHRFLHGPAIDQVFADETQSGQVFWALADHQGTVRDLVEYDTATNTTSVVKHLQYTAFGTITADSYSGLKFLYAYTGREWDPDAQLYYYRARFYDPIVGRFVSQDPISFAGGDTNLYRYVGNSPANFTDPSGLIIIVGKPLPRPSWWPSWLPYPYDPQNFDPADYMNPIGAPIGMVGRPIVRKVLQSAPVTKAVAVAKSVGTKVADTAVAMGKRAADSRVGQFCGNTWRRVFPHAASGVKVGDFTLTDTVAQHQNDVVKKGPFKGERTRPFLNSPHTIREIMAAGKGVPDPGGFPGALRWDVPGTFRGTRGTWELVVDPKTNTILHFNFVGGR